MEKTQLFDEIRQLTEQYKREVPNARRVWPTSIRERVIALRRLELSSGEISRQTGIPAPTVYVMCRGKPYPRKNNPPGFLPVQVSKNVDPLAKACETQKLVAILPGGIRVEGIPVETLLELCRRLSK